VLPSLILLGSGRPLATEAAVRSEVLVNDGNLHPLLHVVVVDDLASCAPGLVRCRRTRMSVIPHKS
jgi:hypothetical protein